MNQIVEHKDCKEIRGMIKTIPYLLKVKENYEIKSFSS